MLDTNLDHLLIYCAGWWVFATIVAFLAAMLFWNKGAAQMSGQSPVTSNMAVKLTGASAIWGFTLLVFFFVNPTKVYSDAKGLLLVSTREKLADGRLAPAVINVQDLPDVDFRGQALTLELIPRESVFNLLPEGNKFAYYKPIPVGFYELRITDVKTGKYTTRQLQVAEPGS